MRFKGIAHTTGTSGQRRPAVSNATAVNEPSDFAAGTKRVHQLSNWRIKFTGETVLEPMSGPEYPRVRYAKFNGTGRLGHTREAHGNCHQRGYCINARRRPSTRT